MTRRALRLAAGTATLAAGGWLLRALHGAPAALGADPAAIQAVSDGSPNYRDGPRRLHPPPVQLDGLPAVDAVVISHDHYDHLDIDTVLALARTQRAPFFVPLGVGAHLRSWGIPEHRIVELDWNQSAQVDKL